MWGAELLVYLTYFFALILSIFVIVLGVQTGRLTIKETLACVPILLAQVGTIAIFLLRCVIPWYYFAVILTFAMLVVALSEVVKNA